jgi:hypothetical protein
VEKGDLLGQAAASAAALAQVGVDPASRSVTNGPEGAATHCPQPAQRAPSTSAIEGSRAIVPWSIRRITAAPPLGYGVGDVFRPTGSAR